MEPFPASLFNRILPPCWVTIALETCKPRPIPAIFRDFAELARQNRLNKFCCSLLGMPMPSSRTLTVNCSPFVLDVRLMVTGLSGGEYLQALFSKLFNNWDILN